MFIGCADDSSDNTESLLIALLDDDDVAGVDGFETNGDDAELDHESVSYTHLRAHET